jgi:hypothetical protein
MGKLLSNKAVGDLQGKIGGLVYAHRADGSVIVRRAPERIAGSSPKQKAVQARMLPAQRYVRRLKANPQLYAPYQHAAAAVRRRARDMAIADFLTPPQVRDVDLSGWFGQPGQGIQIEAVDDFEVATVAVLITQLDGTVIEQGPASRAAHPAWVYTTRTAIEPGTTVAVQVTVVDRPGNAVSKVFHHAITADPSLN